MIVNHRGAIMNLRDVFHLQICLRGRILRVTSHGNREGKLELLNDQNIYNKVKLFANNSSESFPHDITCKLPPEHLLNEPKIIHLYKSPLTLPSNRYKIQIDKRVHKMTLNNCVVVSTPISLRMTFIIEDLYTH